MKDKNLEDIEKTLNQNTEGEEKNYDDEGISSENIDTISEVTNIFMGSASNTLSDTLNNEVEITFSNAEILNNIENFYTAVKKPFLVELTFTEGLCEKIILALKKEDAEVMANLLEEKEEIQTAVIEKIFKKIADNASTSLSNILNTKVNISSSEVISDEDKKAELIKKLTGQKVVALKSDFKIGDLLTSEIIQIMSAESAEKQANRIAEIMKEAGEKQNDNPQQVTDDFIQENTSEFKPSPDSHQPHNQVTVQPVQFTSFDDKPTSFGKANQNLNLVMDVNLGLTVELGRAELPIKNVLELTRGSIIELDKIAGEPVELYANGKLIAKGEVVVIEDNFGLRITSIVSPEQRVKSL